ncbi:MAG: carboxypeptidase regulatory-like domain-containing protein [Bryobacteraceae bacterium]
MKNRGSHIVALVLACMALVYLPGFGQEFRATLTGRVLDSSGAVVPGAKVVVKNLATSQTSATVTGEQGVYTLPYLVPATYEVKVEVSGFKTYLRENLTLAIGQVANLQIRLEVGSASESITVTGEAPMLDAADGLRGSVLSSSRLQELPVSGHMSLMYARVAPGVTYNGMAYASHSAAQGTIEQWSVNGGKMAYNNFLLDGVENNVWTPWSKSGRSVGYVPPVDAIQEYKVQTNLYDAQYGDTGGGVVNMTFKSGTNRFHGSVFEFAQRAAWSANSFQNNSKGAARSNQLKDQYGFQIDGPVVLPGIYNGKNKTFFMGSFESFGEQNPNPATLSVPTPEMLTGDFSKFTDSVGRQITIYNPWDAGYVNNVWTRTPFANNVIPSSSIDPIAQKILSYMHKPNTTTAGAAPGYARNNFFMSGGDNAADYDIKSWTAKINQLVGDKHNLSFRTSWNKFKNFECGNALRDNPGVNGDWGQMKENWAFATDWVGTISPTFLANVRVAFTRWTVPRQVKPNLDFDMSALGFSKSVLEQLPVSGFPTVSVSEYMALGGSSYFYANNAWSTAGSLTKIRGAHTVRAGVDLRMLQFANQDPKPGYLSISANKTWTQKTYNVADSTSGDSAASFLLGAPSGGSIPQAVYPMYSYHNVALWVADDWKVSRRLTLNVGLRWDMYTPVRERFDRLNVEFDTNVVNPVDALIDRATYPNVSTIYGGLKFAGVDGNSRYAADIDYNNIQPRFGFGYQLAQNVILRGGWGRVYMTPSQYWNNNVGYTTTTSMVTSVDGGFTPIPNILNNPFPDGIVPAQGSQGGLLTALGGSFNFFRRNFQIPYTNQFSFGVQWGLPANMKLDLSYVGSRSPNMEMGAGMNNYTLDFRKKCNIYEGGNAAYCDEQLPNPFKGIEAFKGTGRYSSNTLSRATLATPYSAFGGLTAYGQNLGKLWYNSMQAEWEIRNKGGLNLVAAYTFSKNIEQAGYLDVQANILQRSLASFDRPHSLTLSGTYSLPFGRGRHWLNKSQGVVNHILGGWDLAGMLFVRSGVPTALAGRYVKSAKVPVNWNAANVRLFKGCVAQQSNDGSIKMLSYSVANGCTDYNFLIMPSYAPAMTPYYTGEFRLSSRPSLDVNLMKVLQFTESIGVRISAEAFNATNSFDPYTTQPNTSLTSSLFGTLNMGGVGRGGGSIPRAVQLGVKLQW